MRVWNKVWPVVGLVSLVLTACGGGGDGGTSSAQPSSVNTSSTGTTSGDDSATVVSTLDFNVSQVFTNWYSSASSFTVSGVATLRNGAGSTATTNLQVTIKVTPLADGSFKGQVAKRAQFSSVWLVNGVVDPESNSDSTEYYTVGPFRLLGIDLPFSWTDEKGGLHTGVSTEVLEDIIALPAGVKVGTSAPFGSSKLSTISPITNQETVSFSQAYSYSVEAASSADTAWVCQNIVARGSQGVLEDEEKVCLLTNANSEILGMKAALRVFDSAGTEIGSAVLR